MIDIKSDANLQTQAWSRWQPSQMAQQRHNTIPARYWYRSWQAVPACL